MNVIDHAIQVPVSSTNIWNLISNPENNPKWLVGCTSISFLNSIRRGIGMRWRYKDTSGREYVTEVTAWYDGLGFEYRIVDGVAYSVNKGRLRLQEVPEGTVVQWTFSYELNGLLGGLRNSIGTKRNLDSTIIESLRNLYRVSKEQYKEIDMKDVKSLMRDAPNVQERSSYKPRYPSVLEEGKPKPTPTTPEPAINDPLYSRAPISEPPVADDDTRPNPALQPMNVPVVPEPSFLSGVDTEFKNPTPTPTAPPVTTDLPVALAQPNVESVPPAPLPSKPAEPTPSTEPKAPFNAPPPAVMLPKIDPLKIDKRDTATISVFELFGLPKPSDSSQITTIKVDSEPLVEQVLEVPLIKIEEAPAPAPNVKPEAKSMADRTTIVGEIPTQTMPISDFGKDPIKAPDIDPYEVRVGLRRRLRKSMSRLRIPN